MESNSITPQSCHKEDNLIEVTDAVQVTSESTNNSENCEKSQDNETSVKVKRVSFHIVPDDKVDLKINTIQNIYNPVSKDSNDGTVGNLTRSNSFKNRINKSTYLKLHRHSLSSTDRSSVGKLKGKYENIAKQTDNSLKSNNIIAPTNSNIDKASKNVTSDLINSEERLPSEFQGVKEKPTVLNNNLKLSLQETSTLNNINELPEHQSINCNENDQRISTTDYLLKTTSTIEKLQNNLNSKLSKETIERLKSKYSPSSFGYSKTVTSKSNEENFSKIPVPTPRTLLTPVLKSKIEHVPETQINKETGDSAKVKLVKLEDFDQQTVVSQQVSVEETKQETASVIKEDKNDKNYVNKKTPIVSLTKIDKTDTKNKSFHLPDDKNNNVTENEFGPKLETIEVTYSSIEFAEPEARHLIVRRSSSEDSVHKVESFLSEIIMEKKPKEKKRSSSFRKLAGIFGRDRKKSDGDKGKNKKDNGAFTDNVQNESQAFDRHSSHRHTTDNSFLRADIQKKIAYSHNTSSSPVHYSSTPPHRHFPETTNLRGRYTEMNGTNGALFKSNRSYGYPGEDYVPMDSNLQNSKNIQSSYMNVGKYGDTSSSSSNTLDSENRSCTYQNALIAQAEIRQSQMNGKLQRTGKHNHSLNLNKNTFPDLENCLSNNDSLEHYSKNELEYLQVVKPKASIPINSERPLPNPYRNSHDNDDKIDNLDNGKTIDRNLNISNTKPYPYKNDVYNKTEDLKKNQILVEDVYGTVFDSISPAPLSQNKSKFTPSISSEHSVRSDSSSSYRSQSSPKSVEGTKLRLPSNREKVDLQPRLRSPLPQNKISTDKIIATELLRHSKSPTRDSPINVEVRKTNSLTKMQRSPQVSLNRPTSYQKAYNRQFNSNRDAHHTSAGSVDSFQELKSTESVVNSESPILTARDLQTNYSNRISDLDHNRMVDLEQKQIFDFEQNRIREIEQNRQKINSPTVERSNVTTNAVIHKNPEDRIQNSYSSLPTLRRGVSPQQLQKPVYYSSDKSPSNASLNSSLGNVRSYTPTQKLPVTSSPKSPEKQHIINNVEAFYWRELKKLKYKEEQELSRYRQNQLEVYGYVEDPVITRRSRSVSPSVHRGQRSLSLPRDGRGNLPPRGDMKNISVRDNSGLYSSGRHLKNGPEAIPEGRPVIAKQPITLPTDSTYGQVGQPSFQRNPHFVRNTFERSTIGPVGTNQSPRHYENYYIAQNSKQIYAPIFKRGSLTGSINMPDSQLSKKVSFTSNSNSNNSIWPTKNGYTRSPPTRRIEKESATDDDVFLPNSPRTPRNVSDNIIHVSNYGYANYSGVRNSGIEPNTVEYGTHQAPRSLPQQEVESIYGGRQKQITVSNRVCDIYGRIHDSDKNTDSNQRVLSAPRNYGEVKQVGLVYGQLQPNNVGNQETVNQNYNQTSSPNLNFVRGTRLTASANDMYRRYPHEPSDYQYNQRHQNEVMHYSHEKPSDAPNRPLPPIPYKQNSRVPIMRKVVRDNAPSSNFENELEPETKQVYYPKTKQKNFSVIGK